MRVVVEEGRRQVWMEGIGFDSLTWRCAIFIFIGYVMRKCCLMVSLSADFAISVGTIKYQE